MTEGALVLEGGSLRGLFTAGVLDVFMERGIQFSYVNGGLYVLIWITCMINGL